MKKQALLLVGLLMSTFAFAQQDTLVSVLQPKHVWLTQTDSTLRLNIVGAKDDDDYRYEYEQVSSHNAEHFVPAGMRWDFSRINLFGKHTKRYPRPKRLIEWIYPSVRLGFNQPVAASDGFNTIFGTNFDAEVGFFNLAISYGRHSIVTGWSYGWTRYRLDGGAAFNFDLERVAVGDYPAGAKAGRSVFRLNRHVIPLYYHYETSSKWGFTVGAQLNINVRPRIYNTYYVDYRKVVDTYKENVPYRPLTASFYGSITHDYLGFFVRYTPKGVFREGLGPQFNALTIGILLGL